MNQISLFPRGADSGAGGVLSGPGWGQRGSRALPPPLRSMCRAGSLQPTAQRPLGPPGEVGRLHQWALGRRGGGREAPKDMGGEFSSFLGEEGVEKALEVWPGGIYHCPCACRDHWGRGILPKRCLVWLFPRHRYLRCQGPALDGPIARAFASFSAQLCLGLLVSHRAASSQATCTVI